MAARPRVLVVEDDASLRRVLELRLHLEGFDVSAAEDGQAALDMLEDAHPQIVICDLMMPRVNGFGFCHAARSRPGFERIPIVLLTAHQCDAEIEDLLEIGDIVYMNKPFDAPLLAGTLREMLGVGAAQIG